AVPGQLVAGKNRRVLEYPIAHHELAGSAEGWAGEGREPRQSQVTEAQFAVELEADGRVAAQVLDIADQGAVVLLPEVGPGILQLAWEQACAVQDALGRETPLGESGKLELQSAVHGLAPGRGGGVGADNRLYVRCRGLSLDAPGAIGVGRPRLPPIRRARRCPRPRGSGAPPAVPRGWRSPRPVSGMARSCPGRQTSPASGGWQWACPQPPGGPGRWRRFRGRYAGARGGGRRRGMRCRCRGPAAATGRRPGARS